MDNNPMQVKASEDEQRRKSFRRGGMIVGALALATAVGASLSTPAEGFHHDPVLRLRDQAAIEDLSYCYAAGTDAIGRGDLQAGKSIYQTCFTQNAVIAASFPDNDPNDPPDLTTVGPDAWADVVDSVFVDAGYVSTQHIITNIRIEFQGINTATVTSYLNATHVLDSFGSIILANGTYVDTVVRTPHGWRISERTLELTTFMQVDSPPPPP